MTRGGVRRARGGRDARLRALQRDGHRLDDDLAGRGARHVACRGPRRSPPSTRGADARRRGDRARARSSSRATGRGPSQILTAEAFDNAITLLMAIGGSHQRGHPPARARRPRRRAARRSTASTSSRGARRCSSNVRPSGEHLVEQLLPRRRDPRRAARARAAAARRARSPSPARTLARGIRRRRRRPTATVIAALDAPFAADGGIAVLRGSLAPDGAVIKRSAASPELLRHRGPAVVFEDIDDVARADRRSRRSTSSPTRCSCCATPGRRAAPGMPEWGQLPIPSKLLRARRHRHGADLGCADERHRLRHRRPPRRARSRRPAGPLARCATATRSCSTSRAGRLDARHSRPPSSRAGSPRRAARRPKYRRGYGATVPRARAAGRRGLRLRLPAPPPGEARRARAARAAQRLDRRLVIPNGRAASARLRFGWCPEGTGAFRLGRMAGEVLISASLRSSTVSREAVDAVGAEIRSVRPRTTSSAASLASPGPWVTPDSLQPASTTYPSIPGAAPRMWRPSGVHVGSPLAARGCRICRAPGSP